MESIHLEVGSSSILQDKQQAPPPKVDVPQYSGDMPDEDVDENPQASPPAPTSPSLANMENIQGYQNIGFSGDFLPPPPFAEVTHPPEERKDLSDIPVITEEEAKLALRSFVGQHCCYGKAPAEELTITGLKSTSAYQYTLETFTEARSTEWAHIPYKGGLLDGPENGPAPGPWDVPAQCKELFKDEKKELEVPHTATAKACHNCFACGFVRCWNCQGRGRNRCISCQGSGKGMQEDEKCLSCNGEGKKCCITCNGKGMTICTTCDGHRNIKYYIKLKIEWHKHDDDHIVEKTALQDKLIKNAEGQLVFEETYPRVYPIHHCEEQEINQASANLVAKHQYPMERILMQRHRVKVVPVTVCNYKWKETESDFIVYGFEKKVECHDYPQQFCCGCSLL